MTMENGTTTTDEASVRRQLEELAAKSREPESAQIQSRVEVARAERFSRFEQQRAERIREAEAEEAASLARGNPPRMMFHEAEETFGARSQAWLDTPHGLEYQRKRQIAYDDKARQQLPELAESYGVPRIFVDRIVAGDLTETAALAAVRSPSVPQILVMAGDIGVGKSLAAAWWLLAPCLPGVPLRLRHRAEPQPVDPWRRATSAPLCLTSARLARWERYDDKAIAKLLNAERLVVDDLGTEFADAKGSTVATFDEVINHRWSNRRPTVLTTNHTAASFKAQYGERIADRIREDGGFLALAGASLRRVPA